VLNPTHLAERFYVSAGQVLKIARRRATKKTATILVVDDSITTRTLEKSVLESYGYNVRLAVDGSKALAHLRTEKVDLVMTDVQMPVMDGFELLHNIKKDPTLADIPVIIVSSLEEPEEKARGMGLGAEAYIVKRKFDQRDLLETLRQIL